MAQNISNRKTKGNNSRTSDPKNAKKATASKRASFAAPLFWIFFFVLIIVLFLAYRDTIRETIDKTGFFEKLGRQPNASSSPDGSPEPSLDGPSSPPSPNSSPLRSIDANELTDGGSQTQTAVQTEAGAARTNTSDQTENALLNEEGTAAAPPPDETPSSADGAPAPPAASEIIEDRTSYREWALWFSKVDDDGHIGQYKIQRSLPASDSPLSDAIEALLKGPSKLEAAKDLTSLIPPGTALLSALVRGDTAYLSFNENFHFNPFGIEGYAGQLRQIIWTATEFPNIQKVQILIEGRRVDYLGEGIWIGSPLNRDSL